MKRKSRIVVVLGVLLALVGAVLLVHSKDSRETLLGAHTSVNQRAAKSFTRVSDRSLPEGLTVKKRVELEQAMNELITSEKRSGAIAEASVFYRDLNNGPVININDRADFYPASLLKLPLAVAYFKEKDSDAAFLENKIQYTGPNGVSIEVYPSQMALVPGSTYSLLKLIEIMLEDSNNDAAAILAQYLGKDKTNIVYEDLGVEEVDDYNTYTTDVKTFSGFFRVLYNVSYLSQESSEDLLRMLSQATFTQGLVAGVPESIPVAHKFGQRTVANQEVPNQLHDCGIVYVPEKNYILCVMTRGSDYERQASVIAKISQLTYSTITDASP